MSGRRYRSAPEEVVWLDDSAIIHETENAIKVENARGNQVWLPKSLIGFYDDGRISVPQWLADREELG